MKAEIISIGTEITTGQNLDTNAQWLSRQLAVIGIPVGFHTTVSDDLTDNVNVFRIAASRAKIVLASGGLGPTLDDLTREALALLTNVQLVENAESLQRIQAMFAKRGRVMPDRNKVQALFPQGAEPILNERGTAPGIWLPIGDSVIACMPGVPSEMFHMFETQVKPRLLAMGFIGGVQIERKINTFGLGESGVEERLKELTARGRIPEIGITVSDAIVSLRIIARATTLEEALALAAPDELAIRERLAEMVYGVEQEELQDVVVALLAKHRLTIATAESVTGGLVANRLVTVPGVSEWFHGGIVAYDNRVKVQQLAVPESLIQQHGAVSKEVVEAMAIGCRTKLGTDLAIATVGLAGPGGGTEEKPVGLVFVALASDAGVITQSFNWNGTRTEVQSRAAKLALNVVRLYLLKRGS